MSQIINDVCNLAMKKKYRFILISGNGGAGKTTLAKILQKELEHKGQRTAIISTDEFMLDKAYRKNTFITYTDKNGKPTTNYVASTFPQAYDYKSLNDAIGAQNADIIIIEGIGVSLILENFENAYKIFLQVDKETEYQRRIHRARSGADLSRERMEIRYEQFELFILPFAEKFDLRLTSEDDFSYSVLKY